MEQLRALARQLHAHYDVEPELDVREGARVKTGLYLRLWGVHAKGSRPLPACPKCRAIFSRLRAIAEYALDAVAPVVIAFEPLRPALYDSRVVPGTDEVALRVRIAAPIPEGDASEERCLKLARARLRELGVPEQ